jgi:hypothetical protein
MAGIGSSVCRQMEKSDAPIARERLERTHMRAPDTAAAQVTCDNDTLNLGPMTRVRRAAQDDLTHRDHASGFFGDEQQTVIVERGYEIAPRLHQIARVDRLEQPQRHARAHGVNVQAGEGDTDDVGLSGADAADATAAVIAVRRDAAS